jgi:hypothetical protein
MHGVYNVCAFLFNKKMYLELINLMTNNNYAGFSGLTHITYLF